jgi:2-polyprenyl-3-methyl-5-hydroxy-6-metoxy-1,4-benzoquinol methylase
MKLVLNRILRYLGYEIRRIPPRAQQHALPDPDEIAALDQILRQFVKNQPDASACSDIRELRKYLSDSRIAFFQEVIYLCHRHRINLDARRITDIGSGTGYLLRLVHQAAPSAKLSGYDTFGEMMALAKLLCPVASFEVRDLFQLEDKFDVIFCTEILEHLEQPGQALRAVAKLVLPGGALVLTVPDGRKDQQESGARREDGTGYWGHIHFWSPESWRLFLDRELGAHYRIECGQVATGENYGVVFPLSVPGSNPKLA